MNPILKNVLAVIAGAILGGLVNQGIVMLSGHIIPLPEGVDVNNFESLKAGIHLFEPKHFIMPFLAHALGTLSGAFLTTKLAASKYMQLAFVIGILNLIGGIGAVMMLPAPMWFNITDLVLAYIPMALLGYKLAFQKSN